MRGARFVDANGGGQGGSAFAGHQLLGNGNSLGGASVFSGCAAGTCRLPACSLSFRRSLKPLRSISQNRGSAGGSTSVGLAADVGVSAGRQTHRLALDGIGSGRDVTPKRCRTEGQPVSNKKSASVFCGRSRWPPRNASRRYATHSLCLSYRVGASPVHLRRTNTAPMPLIFQQK